jgi:glutamyl-tRNA synthetase
LIPNDDKTLDKVISLVKDRCTLLTDFTGQTSFFFKTPEQIDKASILPKWNEQKQQFFRELIRTYKLTTIWNAHETENALKEIAAAHQLKPGELMLPLRIMLVGGKFGPGVFDIAEIIGREETILRITTGLTFLAS